MTWKHLVYLQRFVNIWWYGHKLGTRHSSVYLFNKDTGSNSVGHGPECRPLVWTSPPRGCLLFGKSRGQPFPNLFRHGLWLQLRQIITNGLISVNDKKTSLNIFLFYSPKKKCFSWWSILGEKHKHNVGYNFGFYKKWWKYIQIVINYDMKMKFLAIRNCMCNIKTEVPLIKTNPLLICILLSIWYDM